MSQSASIAANLPYLRRFARALTGISPDLIFKIEPMPIQHAWN